MYKWLKAFFYELWTHYLTYAVVGLVSATLAFSSALLLDQQRQLKSRISDESDKLIWMVFLEEGTKRLEIEQAINNTVGIKSVRFISKDKALEIMQKDRKLAQEIVLIGRNPFPESFEVNFDKNVLRSDFLARFTEKIASLSGVEEIVYDIEKAKHMDWLKKRSSQLDLAVYLVYSVGILLIILLLGRVLFFPKSMPSLMMIIATCAICGVCSVTGCWVAVIFVSNLLLKSVAVGLGGGVCLGLAQLKITNNQTGNNQ